MNLFADHHFKILNKTERAQLLIEIRNRMSRLATPFENDTPEKQKARKERGRTDHFYFFKEYLPHYFPGAFSELHRTEVEYLECRGIPGALAAPRGFAKSTIFFGYIIHQGVNGLRHFINLYSGIKDLSELQLECIMLEIEENPRIKYDYGDLRDDNFWSKDMIALKTDCAIKALGPSGRGFKYKNYRPDLVAIDDLENDINVRNRKFVKRQLDWLLQAVMPSIAGGGMDGTLLMIGTILGKKSVLATILDGDEFKSWNRRRFQAIENGQSLWPEVYPLEKLEKINRNMGSRAFAKEYMNNPRDEEQGIREEWIRYMHISEINKLDLYVETATDPSHKSGEQNDYKAIITVGKERRLGIYVILNAWIKHNTTQSMIKATYDVDNRYKSKKYLLETIGGQIYLEDVFELYRQNHKLHRLPVKGIEKHSTDKITRILDTLSPLLEMGKIYFIKGDSDQDLLVEQILDLLDEGVNDDGADALEMVVRSLQERGNNKAEYRSVESRRLKFGKGSW